jgi:hypothetical protein
MAGCKHLQHGGCKRGAQELADKTAMRGGMDTSRTMVWLKNYSQGPGGPAHNPLCKTSYTLL